MDWSKWNEKSLSGDTYDKLFNNRWYEAFEAFARKRMIIYHRRVDGIAEPIGDPILETWKFTNCYRILDRFSQYLIEIVNGKYTPKNEEQHAAQIYIARLYNRAETYEDLPLEYRIEPLTYLEEIKTWAEQKMSRGVKIHSNAFLYCSPFSMGYKTWTELYLLRLKQLRSSGKLIELYNSTSLEDSFNILNTYPGFGDFLSYQFALDYSYLHNISYEDFIVPGPGALNGFNAVFEGLSKVYAPSVMKEITRRGITEFPYLKVAGKTYRLRGNDVQNLFCEFSKYARTLKGGRPKNKHRPTQYRLPAPVLPKAWV